MRTHLVIADAHSHPKDDWRRFDWLGRMIVAEQPEVIINLGDLGTYDSVSFHEQNGRKPTLKEDIDAEREATARLWTPTYEHNSRARRNKHKIYDPDTVECEGNHEYRLERRRRQDPDGLASVIDFDDLRDFSVWKRKVPYGRYIVVDGIQYTHCPMTKMGRPITGVTRGTKIARESLLPTVYGHTHTFDFTCVAMLGDTNGVRWSLNAPAFMPHQHIEDYALGTQTGWCYGVLRIRPSGDPNVPPGFDYVSMTDLEAMYG